jgi:hypothetical protein
MEDGCMDGRWMHGWKVVGCIVAMNKWQERNGIELDLLLIRGVLRLMIMQLEKPRECKRSEEEDLVCAAAAAGGICQSDC